VAPSQDNRAIALNFLERLDNIRVDDLSELVTPNFRYYSANLSGWYVRDLKGLVDSMKHSTHLPRPAEILSPRTLMEDDRVCVQRVKHFDIDGATIPMYSVALICITDGRVSRAKEYSDSALAARLSGALKSNELKSVRQNLTLRSGISRPEVILDFLDDVPGRRYEDAAKRVTGDFANWIPGHGWSNWAEISKIDEEFATQNFNTLFALNVGSITRDGDWVAVEAEGTAGIRTGGLYDNHYLFLFKLHDERIQLWFEYFDTLYTYNLFGFPDYSGDLTKFAQQEFSPLAKMPLGRKESDSSLLRSLSRMP
jgi:ketosteroid isomerase-like protein